MISNLLHKVTSNDIDYRYERSWILLNDYQGYIQRLFQAHTKEPFFYAVNQDFIIDPSIYERIKVWENISINISLMGWMASPNLIKVIN